MTAPAQPLSPKKPAKLHVAVQWAALLVVSLLLATVLDVAGLPAAMLLGPLMVAVVAGTNGATVRVPKLSFASAQAFVGCLVAVNLSPEIFSTLVAGWPLFGGVVLATLMASSFLGWSISRLKILPGTTAVWGSAPGGATAMVLMAGAFGADERLVAFMQYLRVIFVSISAAMIAGLWVDTSSVEVPPSIWLPAIEWAPFTTTLAIAAAGGLAGRLLRLPSPYFLGAAILGTLLHLGPQMPMQLPVWLLGISYMVIGWAIGLNFTRAIIRHAARALPQIVGSIIALMAFCGGLAWLLAHELGIDPLTAYLATSPGGMDSVAIIAAASENVDLSFVMALQSARLVIALTLGPSLARLVARGIKP